LTQKRPALMTPRFGSRHRLDHHVGIVHLPNLSVFRNPVALLNWLRWCGSFR
jgi:hypothetical protein